MWIVVCLRLRWKPSENKSEMSETETNGDVDRNVDRWGGGMKAE